MFNLTVETMDLHDSAFQAYLAAHSITATATGRVYAQPGGGEDVVYSADTRESLEALIDAYLLCGDPEVDANTYMGIIAV